MNSMESRSQLSRSAIPLYIQLATLFRRRIESGQWPTRGQIPTVEELAAECNVARATIRQALGLLENEGLILRYRAKGTFVAERADSQLRLAVQTDLRSMMNALEGATIEILSDSIVSAPPVWPHQLGAASSSYRLLKRRHSRNGIAFLVADVYIDAELAQNLPAESLTTLTALRLASSITGVTISAAKQTITVAGADMEVAEILDLPLNSPLCLIDRSVVDQKGRRILVSMGIYRGDLVCIDMELK